MVASSPAFGVPGISSCRGVLVGAAGRAVAPESRSDLEVEQEGAVLRGASDVADRASGQGIAEGLRLDNPALSEDGGVRERAQPRSDLEERQRLRSIAVTTGEPFGSEVVQRVTFSGS